MTGNHGLVGPSNMGTFRTCSLQRVLIMGKHGNTWDIMGPLFLQRIVVSQTILYHLYISEMHVLASGLFTLR